MAERLRDHGSPVVKTEVCIYYSTHATRRLHHGFWCRLQQRAGDLEPRRIRVLSRRFKFRNFEGRLLIKKIRRFPLRFIGHLFRLLKRDKAPMTRKPTHGTYLLVLRAATPVLPGPKSALYQHAPPKPKGTRGPARKKGDRLPGMAEWAADPKQLRAQLDFDQFGLHATLEVKTMQALYYKSGRDRLLNIVLVRDTQGKRPDQMFYCTKLEWSAREILSAYACRWAIECTFEYCSKFDRWKRRSGTPNQHNGRIPRDFWLEDWEKAAIIAFHDLYPLEGYRRLAYMMLDADIVAVSPSSVYRVLKAAGKLADRSVKPSRKGQGFEQPLRPHEHWHIDFSYINICGKFFFLCSILDGYSRLIIHWEIRETMTEAEVETIVQRAREQYPGERPRIISDNGPQFIAKDFKELILICEIIHVKTSPYYPQSNGEMERWFKTLKGECIRVKTPLSLEDARRLVAEFVVHYNTVRLHSAIGYVTPADKLAGRAEQIWADRRRKLSAAQARRAARPGIGPRSAEEGIASHP